MMHQESVQESVDRSRKRKEQRNRVINEKHTHLKEQFNLLLIEEISHNQRVKEDLVFFQKKQELVVKNNK